MNGYVTFIMGLFKQCLDTLYFVATILGSITAVTLQGTRWPPKMAGKRFLGNSLGKRVFCV